MPPFSQPSSSSSPKRKRTPIPPTPPASSPSNTMRLNTSLPDLDTINQEGRAGSPRTKVSYHFQGLQLTDPIPNTPIPRLDFTTSKPHQSPSPSPDPDSSEQIIRKRVKMLQETRLPSTSSSSSREIPETPDVRSTKTAFKISIDPSRPIDPIIAEKAHQVILHNDIDPVIFTSGSPLSKIKSSASSSSSLSRSYPSINRLSDTKSRSLPRKRSGTPPLTSATLSSPFSSNPELDGEETGVVDPERAAQTWHDDEITGHDPTDPDDDGEGINGIGFKPTAAEAYARTQKRKMQMEQYRTREAREARARRSERRRGGSDGVGEGVEGGEKERRVRFEGMSGGGVAA